MGSSADLGRPFAALLRASFISNLGDGLRLAALPLLATTLTESALLVAALTAAQYLPWIIWAPIAGVIVDRADRRRLILTTQTWRAVIMLVLGVVVLAGRASMWQLLIVAFVITAGEILVDPSVVATVPKIVAPSQLDVANGRLNTVETATNDFAGKTVGAIVFGLAPWLPFLVDGLTYAASTRPFAALPRERSAPARPNDSIRAELGAGLTWIRRHSFLAPLTYTSAVFHMGTGGALAVLVLLVSDELDGEPWVFGVVLAAAALGATITSPAAAGLAARSSRRVAFCGSAALVGLSTLAAAVSTEIWHLVVAWLINGAAFGFFHSIGRSFLQRHTPNEVLGRTAVASRMITRGAFVIGALTVGAIADAIGVRSALAVAALFHLVGAAGQWAAFSREPGD